MTRTRIALFTTSLLFTLGAECPGPADLDEAWVPWEGGVGQPMNLPATVSATIGSAPYAQHAVEEWLAALGCPAIEYVDGPADLEFDLGFTGGDHDDWDLGGETAELVHLEFAEDGRIIRATCTLSSDLDYPEGESTLEDAAVHCVGHAVFALADDPGPPTTVELRSWMSDPLDPLGELTAADRALLQPFCP